jgi:chemotaxis protein CheX
MRPTTDDVASIAQHVLQTMARLNAEPTSTASMPCNDHLLGTIQIKGAWDGEVVIRTSEALARQLAQEMLQVPQGELQNEDIIDVLAEVTNMIGGNIKSQLDSPSSLTLPSVASSNNTGPLDREDRELLCDLVLICEEHPLSIQILERR